MNAKELTKYNEKEPVFFEENYILAKDLDKIHHEVAPPKGLLFRKSIKLK
ncbi:hypothetical protein [Clostridium manihotivorum]|nr:hypothetical protein [Clostridium manihotivorum]